MTDAEDDSSRRYTEALGDLQLLTKHAHAVSASIANKETNEEVCYYASIVLSKMVSHAITLTRILPTTLALSRDSSAAQWDISSVCCLSRAILEANDVLAYLADSKGGQDVRLIRLQVWQLHDLERRVQMLESIGSSDPQVDVLRKSAANIRATILTSKAIDSIEASHVGKIRKGNSPDFLLHMEERCRRAGINHSHYIGAKMFLSAYVHSFPFALHQLVHFRAGDARSLVVLSVPVRYALTYLAKGLKLLEPIFATGLPSPDMATQRVISIWAGIAEAGVSVF